MLDGCASIQRKQIEKDALIVDRHLRDFKNQMRNAYDHNNVEILRWQVSEALKDQ